MPISDNELLSRARALRPGLVDLRRDFHQHPELGYQEHRTSGIAARAVAAEGFEVRTGIARTGVIADLDGGDGPAVALRADMDALPIQEQTGLPFASETPGVMHACGHDAHTAILIGAARLLAQMHRAKELPRGRVRLIFQPSEEGMDDEGLSGGRRMADEGAVDGIVAVGGLHVGAHLPMGRIHLLPGPLFAGSDEFAVNVIGKSAHAARPDDGVDALVLAAQGVLSAQQGVSRRLAPSERGVLTFGTVAGGHAVNIIPDRVELRGTLRYFEPRVRSALHDALRAAFAHVEAWGGEAEVTFREGYPPVVNDDELTPSVRAALEPLVGADGFLSREPSMEAEDFSYLANRSRGVFFWLGAALPETRAHHHPRFDIDEDVLPLGAAILARTAITLLEESDRD
jgi:IAA-amino acid hydrolase